MSSSFLLMDFFVWYYSAAFRDMFALWLNGMWFIVHFFSIPLLLRTLFAPWRRITDTYRRGSIEDLMETFVMNTMTRIFGAVVRSVIIFIGVVCLLVGSVALILSVLLWVALPVASLFAFIYGVKLLVV
jgi:ABC-type multidrug transport system fused ATPase/permease subunit